ncbi:hypothetical protein AJ78_08842, partial [Emergomyces pasteurianus Ep9510]
KALSPRTSVTESPISKRKRNVELIAANLQVPHFRETCLHRDEYRCVVTQVMDFSLWKSINQPPDILYGDMEVAHIIPFVYASWRDISGEKNTANIWEVLFRCFPSLRRTGMRAANINDPSNGITLWDVIRKQFGKFRCAFEPTDTPHVYNFKTYLGYPAQSAFSPPDRKITMRNAPGAEDVASPSRVLLECHWRVAEILNASGMGETIDQIIQEWEDIKEGDDGHACLREDGKSNVSGFLTAALWANGHWVKS